MSAPGGGISPVTLPFTYTVSGFAIGMAIVVVSVVITSPFDVDVAGVVFLCLTIFLPAVVLALVFP